MRVVPSPDERRAVTTLVVVARLLGVVAAALALGAVVAVVVGAGLAALVQAVGAAAVSVACLGAWRAAAHEER